MVSDEYTPDISSDYCFITSYYLFACIRDFTQRGTHLGGFDGQVEQVALLGLHTLGDGIEGSLDGIVVAVRFEVLQALDLLFAHSCVVDFENIDGSLFFETVFVHAHDGLFARVDTSLRACGSLLDTQLGQTGFDSLGHTAQFLDFLDMLPRFVCEFVGQSLYIVRTAHGSISLVM